MKSTKTVHWDETQGLLYHPGRRVCMGIAAIHDTSKEWLVSLQPVNLHGKPGGAGIEVPLALLPDVIAMLQSVVNEHVLKQLVTQPTEKP